METIIAGYSSLEEVQVDIIRLNNKLKENLIEKISLANKLLNNLIDLNEDLLLVKNNITKKCLIHEYNLTIKDLKNIFKKDDILDDCIKNDNYLQTEISNLFYKINNLKFIENIL